jgi:hypothetical protein
LLSAFRCLLFTVTLFVVCSLQLRCLLFAITVFVVSVPVFAVYSYAVCCLQFAVTLFIVCNYRVCYLQLRCLQLPCLLSAVMVIIVYQEVFLSIASPSGRPSRSLDGASLNVKLKVRCIILYLETFCAEVLYFKLYLIWVRICI